MRDFDPGDPARLSVAICDFGLAKEKQYYYGGGAVPTRWMPPEVPNSIRIYEMYDSACGTQVLSMVAAITVCDAAVNG